MIWYVIAQLNETSGNLPLYAPVVYNIEPP